MTFLRFLVLLCFGADPALFDEAEYDFSTGTRGMCYEMPSVITRPSAISGIFCYFVSVFLYLCARHLCRATFLSLLTLVVYIRHLCVSMTLLCRYLCFYIFYRVHIDDGDALVVNTYIYLERDVLEERFIAPEETITGEAYSEMQIGDVFPDDVTPPFVQV